MRKWIIFSSILILCFVGLVIGAYISALYPKNKAADLAIETAKTQAGITTMDEFYLYHGKESYSVVIGSTREGKKQIVWIPDNDEENIKVQNVQSGKTKEEILTILEQKTDPKEIISIKPGMENDVPLWEVTFLDQSGNYNYVYYDFHTGEWLKYYRSI